MTSRFFRLTVVPLAVTLAFAKQPAGPVVFDPDPTPSGAGKLQGETWSKESPSASLWLTRIDEETRKGFVRRRSGLTIDPFVAAPGTSGGFLAFHVLVVNASESRMVFQPQSCRLQTSWKDFQAPLDLPTIEAVYAMAQRPLPDGFERLRAAIIDGGVELRAGEQRDGLLIFHAVDPAVKQFQIDVGATLTKGDPFAFTAFFKKRKK